MKRRLVLVGVGILGTLVALSCLAPQIQTQDPYQLSEDVLARPNARHYFGTDPLGRDLYSRVLAGGRYTLSVGLGTIALGMLFGLPLGLWSGFRGGRWDHFLMRGMDVLLSFPDILLALALMAALGTSLKNAMLALAILYVPKFARVMRASTLVERQKDYVAAARALGCPAWRVLFLHLLPNGIAPVVVVATLSLGTAIVSIAALGFLGLGAQPPLPEWGALLSQGKDYYTTDPHLMLFPGLALALTVLSINLLGDGLRDALDVRAL